MEERLRTRVRERAHNRCEYCQFPESYSEYSFHADHIRPRQHGGQTNEFNLAWACSYCNNHKGPNVAGILEGEIVGLYNPRKENWESHFKWAGPVLTALSPTGTVTIDVLGINLPDAVASRQALLEEGVFHD